MSLWDQFDRFTAVDAATLAIQNNESEAKALLTKMRKAYDKALGETFHKYYDTSYQATQADNIKIRYQSIDDPLPDLYLYSWALVLQAKVLFRPNPSEASYKFFQEWYTNETGSDGAFSSNFDAQEFSRDELHKWLTLNEIKSTYQFKEIETPKEDDAPAEQKIDTKLLATPEELLRAFGVWGLKKTWFNCLGNHDWLLVARRRAGVGGNSSKAPLFCPLQVMRGLATQTKPRKGSRPRVSIEKGWQRLKISFPLVYQANEHLAPDDDQG